MNWKKIRLELADTRDHPRGSVSRGFLICAPLDKDGTVDRKSLAATPQRAKVRRFWSSEADEDGQFLLVNGHWALRCQGKPDRVLPFSKRPFRLGERVDVIDASGQALPFRVASISGLGQELLPS